MEEQKKNSGSRTKATNSVERAQVGSPEVQAKTDGTIKDIEKKTGTSVGEPARQAIYDGIGTGAKSAEE